ncbi:LCP family protein [Kitasatospora azatica]|uniref:LCP family protein n=1 Tax=Kitasatospora azatica TaxID=58347 RepID=UPI00068C8B0A|nr:LCP family protein [Kitasatospora azatica]
MTLDGDRTTEGRLAAPSPPEEGAPQGRAAARRAAQQAAKGRRGKGAPLSKAAKRKRLLKYGAGGTGLVVLLAVVGGYSYVQYLNSNFRKGDLNNGGSALAPESKANAAGQKPINILLLGSDSRDKPEDCNLGGACDSGAPHADVEMLVHLSADRSNASVLSIPRDTQASIPSCTNSKTKQVWKARKSQITDSLNVGEPSCVVDTWETLTGIHIDHYMMIDFAGVVSMADAVGGVDVCTKQNVMDYQVEHIDGVRHETGSHLVLPAGTHTIQGVQALEWLRTRHAWEDGSDIGRTHAQHLYLNSMIRKMKSAKTLADPLKLNDLAVAASKALQVDNALATIQSLAGLAMELNKVPANRITSVTMPFTYVPDPKNPQAALVEPNADSTKLFQMVVNDVPLDRNAPAPTAAPSDAPSAPAAPSSSAPAAPSSAPATPADKSTVRVDVQNASGASMRSTAIAEALVNQGYTHAQRDTSAVPKSPTKLLYPAAKEAEAKALAGVLGLPDAALSESTASATHLTLVVGTDWTTGTQFPTAAPGGSGGAQPPAPTAMPTTAVSQNAGDDANQCMDVNPQKYTGSGNPIYIWSGSTPPNVPQP